MKTDDIKENHITTDDLAFSAYLKMKGFRLIKLNKVKAKSIFTFNSNNSDPDELKVEFINSKFLEYYNEVRNLKKLI